MQTVTVFDTETFDTIKTMPVDKDPDFTFYDLQIGHVFICHGDAAAITAIDPAKEEVIGKINLGGGAEAAVVDGKGNGFVNLEESAEVVNFDPKVLAVNHKWHHWMQDADWRSTSRMIGYSSVAAAEC